MSDFSLPAWAWIPLVVGATLAQTIRNAAQRSVTAQAGTLGATLVRFAYGLPFAALWVALLYALPHSAPAIPGFTPRYFGWVALGGVSQLAATAFLLSAMRERNFVVAVVYAKTEVLQVALFSTLFLGELPGWMTAVAMLVATAGVVLLALPKAATSSTAETGWTSKAAMYGLASGAAFAFSAVGYRGAALEVPGIGAALTGAWGVLWAQAIQTALLGSWLLARDRAAIAAVLRAWRISLLAGGTGAIASIGWFTAFALRPAADVRTLGLMEVVFSFAVSNRVFRERLTASELAGLALVLAGLIVVCAQL